MTTHEVLEIIDNNNDKFTDGDYKKLCDKLAELNKKKKTKYARCEGILILPVSEDGNRFNDERVFLHVEIDDSLGRSAGCEIETGKVNDQYFKSVNADIKKSGYSKVGYNIQSDSYLMILKFEILEV